MADVLAWALIVVIPVGWVVGNWYYGRIYGHRLRWRWFWLSLGALLFSKRMPELEQEG